MRPERSERAPGGVRALAAWARRFVEAYPELDGDILRRVLVIVDGPDGGKWLEAHHDLLGPVNEAQRSAYRLRVLRSAACRLEDGLLSSRQRVTGAPLDLIEARAWVADQLMAEAARGAACLAEAATMALEWLPNADGVVGARLSKGREAFERAAVWAHVANAIGPNGVWEGSWQEIVAADGERWPEVSQGIYRGHVAAKANAAWRRDAAEGGDTC